MHRQELRKAAGLLGGSGAAARFGGVAGTMVFGIFLVAIRVENSTITALLDTHNNFPICKHDHAYTNILHLRTLGGALVVRTQNGEPIERTQGTSSLLYLRVSDSAERAVTGP